MQPVNCCNTCHISCLYVHFDDRTSQLLKRLTRYAHVLTDSEWELNSEKIDRKFKLQIPFPSPPEGNTFGLHSIDPCLCNYQALVREYLVSVATRLFCCELHF